MAKAKKKIEQKETKVKKPIYKKLWFWVIVVIIIICVIGGVGGNDDEEDTAVTSTAETSIYELAESVDMYNGADTEVIGYYSFVEIDSSEVEFEDIEDWYFNYVLENTDDFNWFAIIYTDTEEPEGDAYNYEGVYSNGSMVVTDVTIVKEMNQSHYSYSVSGLVEGTTYFGDEKGESLYEYE